MRTNGVVVFQPMLCDQTDLLYGVEQIGIQNIFTIGSIETFDVSVLRRFAGLDVEQFNVSFFGPGL